MIKVDKDEFYVIITKTYSDGYVRFDYNEACGWAELEICRDGFWAYKDADRKFNSIEEAFDEFRSFIDEERKAEFLKALKG